jgi:lipopolysaccharide assembly outer membrane protein LptD (OstA)
MISRTHWIITAITACHLLAVHSLVTSQSRPPCSAPESQDESTICAQQQEKDGTVYKLHGNARIFYRSYVLSADEVTYDSESGSSTAEGHVVLDGGANDEHIEATRGEYNVQTEFGSFYNVAGTTGRQPRGHNVKLITDNPFAFTGKLVEKRGPGRFVVHDGMVTTCQLPKPSWQFHAARVSVEVAGDARIYNSSFWVHGVPVLYLPFATHPLTKEPHESGFLIPHFGRSSRKGAVIGDGYYWAINRSADLTLGGEYYSQRGGSQNANFRWRPADSAFLDISYFGVIDENGFGGEDAHLNGEGQLPLGFRAVADIEYLSNYAFRSAFSPTFTQAVDSEVKSKVFVSRNSNGFSYNAEVGRYQNFQSTKGGDVVTILRAPGFELSGIDQHLGKTPFLFSVDGAAEGLSRSEPGFRTGNLVGGALGDVAAGGHEHERGQPRAVHADAGQRGARQRDPGPADEARRRRGRVQHLERARDDDDPGGDVARARRGARAQQGGVRRPVGHLEELRAEQGGPGAARDLHPQRQRGRRVGPDVDAAHGRLRVGRGDPQSSGVAARDPARRQRRDRIGTRQRQ